MTNWTDGKPVSWPSGCVLIAMDDPQSDLVSWDQLTDAARAAGETWTQAASSCGGFRFAVEKAGGALEARGDGVIAIIFRTEGYCQSGGRSICDPLSMAITLALLRGRRSPVRGRYRGQRRGVRLERRRRRNRDVRPPDGSETHEMGHLLGLDHHCYEGMGLPRPVDDQGVPIVVCNPPSDEVRASIMYPIDSPSGARRALAADNVRGILRSVSVQSGPGLPGRAASLPEAAARSHRRTIRATTAASCIAGLLLIIASIRRRSPRMK